MTRAEGQLRLGPMGGIAGMDLPAVVALAAAAGVDRRIAWILAPYYEAGLVRGFAERLPARS